MDRNYSTIADTIFAPIYPDIAEVMVGRTGISAGRLLDIGCGAGHMGFAVMERGDFTAVFCDIDPEAVALTERRALERGLSGRVQVLSADVHNLPFEDGSFDLITSRGSMPFWDDQEKAFREIYRLLDEGGRAYIGGGLGGLRHRAEIRRKMEQTGSGFRCFDRKHSKALETDAYIALFEDLGAVYRIIESDEEGRWFIFGRGGGL